MENFNENISLFFFYNFINEHGLKQIYSLVSAKQHHLTNKTNITNVNQLIWFQPTEYYWFMVLFIFN